MARKIPKKIEKLVEEARGELLRIYAHRLQSIILYGSYARGDYAEGSDVDLLLLIDDLQDVMAERDRFSALVSRISLKYDTVVSAIPMDAQVYRQKKTPLIVSVQREGRLL
ncbi:MAG: nucleotidyltransferase domain-containing protein [Desulfuromonadales bacterium]|nr:nucleotidyltransferase domain-containing protein [Desulfuromonadales bacterium]